MKKKTTETALILFLSFFTFQNLDGAEQIKGFKIITDLEYVKDGHERNRLDLYLPEKTNQLLPVIVWVHGGGWSGGSKSNPPTIWLTSQGYAVASISYRLSQHAIFPAQIYDCKAAVRWLRAHAEEYKLDKQNIGAWGSSAGGQLVALMGTTSNLKEFEGAGGNFDQSSKVQAVVDMYGPTDFLTVGPKETRTKLLGQDAQENKEKAKKASPINFVTKNASPFLIFHGDQDKAVPILQSETFSNALKEVNVETTFIKLEGAGHGGPLFSSPETRTTILSFFNKHLKNNTKKQ